MMKIIGLGKKRIPATDDQIRKHKDLCRQVAQWKSDLERMRTISLKLDNAYRSHKGDFALGRYEELKSMIKDAIQEYGSSVQVHQSKTGVSLNSASDKYTDKKGAYEAQSKTSGGGIIAQLRNNAAGFATQQEESSKQELSYSSMSCKQVEDETEQMRKDISQMKHEYRQERDTLEKLAKDYEDSKKYGPHQRYPVLKAMIKNVTRSSGSAEA